MVVEEKHLKLCNDNIVPSFHADDKPGSDIQKHDGNKIKPKTFRKKKLTQKNDS